jgi:SAM-dependent methyltransferase
MTDVVEHLHPPELARALLEAHRVLRPGGWLVVHTMPNRLYHRFGYPVTRWAQRVRLYEDLPADPRTVHGRLMHVNEQTPRALARVLREAGFLVTVTLAKYPDRPGSPIVAGPGSARRRWQQIAERLLALPGLLWLRDLVLYRWPPLAALFANDIFAVAVKPGRRGPPAASRAGPITP